MHSTLPDRKRVLVMVHMDGAYARTILAGIADYADRHAAWQYRLEPAIAVSAIGHGQVDGMIVEAREWEIATAVRQTKIPVITVANQPIPEGPPAVVVDNHAVGRMGAEHLANLGLKYLAFIPVPRTPSSFVRAEGFAAVCVERGISYSVCDEAVVADAQKLVEWLRGLPDPVGIMAGHDWKALEVASACRLAGRRIPDQVALLGVDNDTDVCRLADPPLSSIDHGTRGVGYQAARLLQHWMSTGERPPSPTIIQPVGVVSRPSTDSLTISDPDVVAAIRFIRAHADEPVKVRDILKHVALSRRTLELHFAATLGRSIHQEISRVRIERARQLLIETDWSMVRVAEACGFSLPSQFSFAFKRAVGTPPLQYRQQFRTR